MRVPLFPILLVNFIGTLGFSLVLPFLVFLVTKFGGNAEVYGLLGATYPTFQVMGAPVLGRWSDIYGRRKVLLLSQAGTLFSWLIFLVALFLPMSELVSMDFGRMGQFVLTLPLLTLFLARAIDGLTGGNISVANAYLADITDEADRGKNFGRMAISSNLGFILGPALAGLLGGTALAETLPVLAAIAISTAATLIIAFYLPESRPCAIAADLERSDVRQVFGQETRNCIEPEGADKTRLRDILEIKDIPFLLLLYFLVYLGFTFFYTAFPVHVTQVLNWTIFDLGIFFSFLGGMMILVQGPVLSKLSTRFSEASLIVFGSLVLGGNFLVLTSHALLLLYVAALMFALGNGLMWPSLLSLLSKAAGDKYQGSVQGIAGSFGSFASIIGLVMGGILYSGIGVRTFWVSAAVIFLVCILSVRLIGLRRGDA